MNRQKTKKWANFKPQNYDGDDWGAADYDDPEPPPPPRPLGPRHAATHSSSPRQSQPAAPPPPLRTQTQPYPAAATAGPAQPEHAPAPPSAGPVYSLFPPRKSSLGHNDVAGAVDAARQAGPSPRATESPRPWMEGRSASPQSAGALPSLSKPLAPTRPNDVYRNTDGERGKKEWVSSEPGAPGPDRAASRGTTTRRTEDTDTGRGPQPAAGLAAAAGRRGSEYGAGGLLLSNSHGSHGSAEHGAEPPSAQEEMQPAVSLESDGPAASHGQLRRFSTSPQLPDLARLSGFGEDLFSSSSLFRDSRPPESGAEVGNTQLPVLGEDPVAQKPPGQSPAASAPQAADAGPAADAEVPKQASRASADADSVSSPPNEPDRPIGPPLRESSRGAAPPPADASGQQQPPAAGPREATSSGREQPATAETATTAGEIPASPRDHSRDAASAPSGAGTDHNRPDPTASNASALGQRSSGELDRPEHADPPGKEQSSSSSSPAAPIPPRAPSPLRTSSPALSTTLDMASRQSTHRMQAGEVPATATGQPGDITPTAPLNPRRGSPDAGFVVPPLAPPPFGAGSSFDAPSSSPVKDSDVLSEEILKSLGPMRPSDDAAETGGGGSTAAYRAAAGPPRESSYLGDFYDDYWSATDDKPELGLFLPGRTSGREGPTQTPPPVPAKVLAEGPAGSPADAPEPGRPQGAAATESCAEPKSLSSEVGRAAAGLLPPTTPPLRHSPGTRADAASETDQAAAAAAGAGPRQQTPQRDMFGRTSPSPRSALSERRGSEKRLSLADEKVLLQGSPNPFSPSPPLEQHPVFADNTPQHPPPPPPLPRQLAIPDTPPSPRREAAATTANVLPFRSIMEMASPAERIRHFDEARLHFAAVDTGLDEWLRTVLSRHPEHAGSDDGAPPASSGSNTSVQHPQHHQLLLQHGGPGGFVGHASNQVGARGKEFLMAAGKAGKGLLSKGRNKLRGTGDRVFSSSAGGS